MHTQRDIKNFGKSQFAFVTSKDGQQIAVSYRKLRKIPTERTWRELERRVSFAAPEAQ